MIGKPETRETWHDKDTTDWTLETPLLLLCLEATFNGSRERLWRATQSHLICSQFVARE
jgi:hypothetical protein